MNYTDELLFEGFGVAEKNFLTDFDRMDMRIMAPWALTFVVKAFSETCCLSGPRAMTRMGRRRRTRWLRRRLGMGARSEGRLVTEEDGLGIVLEKKRERSRGGKY